MRKILGLLWTVTMSSNILPMIISQQHPNSKISIQNNIVIQNPQNPNYVALKNNFMIYGQEQWNYCVPAVVKSIINYINNTLYSQDTLASEMETDNGTPINKAIPVLNQYVNFSSRPSIKKYQNYFLPKNFWEKEEEKLLFQNLVKFSLKNDMPIILDIEGTPPWENKPIRHAVVISAMFISDNLDNTIYYVKDPSDKNVIKNFRGSNLMEIFNLYSGNIVIPQLIDENEN